MWSWDGGECWEFTAKSVVMKPKNVKILWKAQFPHSLYTKFQQQEITWNYDIFRSAKFTPSNNIFS